MFIRYILLYFKIEIYHYLQSHWRNSLAMWRKRKGAWEESQLTKKWNFTKESIEEGTKHRIWKGGEEGTELSDHAQCEHEGCSTVSPDDCQPAGHTEGRDRHSPWGPPRACRTTQVPAGKCDQNPQTKSTLLLKTFSYEGLTYNEDWYQYITTESTSRVKDSHHPSFFLSHLVLLKLTPLLHLTMGTPGLDLWVSEPWVHTHSALIPWAVSPSL